MEIGNIFRTAFASALACTLAIAAHGSQAACLSAEVESNNSDTSANSGICSGTAISGTIGSTSDLDWFKIEVTSPGIITVNLAHDSGIDLDWYLYKATGAYVAYRSTASNPETGTYNALTTGAYYVRVKSYTGSGRYTLNLSYPGATGGGGGGTPTACTLPSAVNLGKTGNATPRLTTTTGGAVLMGGGMDVDNAIKWMIAKSGGGDFVVIRSSGTNAYNDYIYGLGGVNSVQTLLITSTTQANNACVVQTIRNAGAVFLAGGDQANYINYFKGQGVGNALNYLINTKRAPIGGTSAGMAIQGQYYHPGGADNATVLNTPTTAAIGNNFLAHGGLSNLIAEPHFAERARQPRLSGFMASMLYNYGVTWQSVRGVSADEATAVAIDTDGIGKVFGAGNVNFVRATGSPETLAPSAKLTWYLAQRALQVSQVAGTTAGTNTFNLGTWTGSAVTTRYWAINNGVLAIY